MNVKRHVALIVETSSVYGRDLLSGIVRYMRMHDQWSVFLEQRDLGRKPPAWLSDWRGDGIISRATTPHLLAAVANTGVPLVELTDRRGDSTLPEVRSDDKAIGRIGAHHLLERGFQRFGFCGFRNESWSRRREEGFISEIQQRPGNEAKVYNSHWHGPGARPWDEEQSRIIEWLRSLTPPFAVMACNDERGKHVLDACATLQLAVPEQAAIVGVDDDELLCRICSPPLSSVKPNAELVGYRAAELLAQLMDEAGERKSDATAQADASQRIPPLGVTTRQSTDVVAIEDRELASALHYIRQHACRGLTVDQVVRHNPISRSTLERQVRKYLGRTPQEEIRQVQVNRASELLVSTDLSIEQIAPLCGFQHPEYFHVVFKRRTGMTPGQFRQQAGR